MSFCTLENQISEILSSNCIHWSTERHLLDKWGTQSVKTYFQVHYVRKLLFLKHLKQTSDTLMKIKF